MTETMITPRELAERLFPHQKDGPNPFTDWAEVQIALAKAEWEKEYKSPMTNKEGGSHEDHQG